MSEHSHPNPRPTSVLSLCLLTTAVLVPISTAQPSVSVASPFAQAGAPQASATWWQAEAPDSAASYFMPLAADQTAETVAAMWRDAQADDSAEGVWIHGAERPGAFPAWLAISELARTLDEAGHDAALLSVLDKQGLSEAGRLTVVETLMESRLDSGDLKDEVFLAPMKSRLAWGGDRSPDVETAMEATRTLQQNLKFQDWEALRGYLIRQVVPALSVRVSDSHLVTVVWSADGEVRATYRGAGTILAQDLLPGACRQALDLAGLPIDDVAMSRAAAPDRLRDGFTFDCVVQDLRVDTKNVETTMALVASDTLPESMSCGESRQVAVTMRNTGSTTWSYANCFRLGSHGAYDPFFDANVRFNLPTATVAPDAETTFVFTLDAPTTEGTYLTDWQMIEAAHCGGVGWFGEVASQEVDVSCEPDAEVVSFNPPASMVCGEVKTAQVTLKNTGSTTWTHGSGVFDNSYFLGKPSADSAFWYGDLTFDNGEQVAPGQSHTFDLTYRPIGVSGSVVTDFRMRKGADFFGDTASGTVQVSCDPRIVVYSGAIPICSRDICYDNSYQVYGSPHAATEGLMRIENQGTDPLIIQNPNSLISGTAISQLEPLPSPIPPGGQVGLKIRIEAHPVGSYESIATLTFHTNESSEPFTMTFDLISD